MRSNSTQKEYLKLHEQKSKLELAYKQFNSLYDLQKKEYTMLKQEFAILKQNYETLQKKQATTSLINKNAQQVVTIKKA